MCAQRALRSLEAASHAREAAAAATLLLLLLLQGDGEPRVHGQAHEAQCLRRSGALLPERRLRCAGRLGEAPPRCLGGEQASLDAEGALEGGALLRRRHGGRCPLPLPRPLLLLLLHASGDLAPAAPWERGGDAEGGLRLRGRQRQHALHGAHARRRGLRRDPRSRRRQPVPLAMRLLRLATAALHEQFKRRRVLQQPPRPPADAAARELRRPGGAEVGLRERRGHTQRPTPRVSAVHLPRHGLRARKRRLHSRQPPRPHALDTCNAA